MLPTELAIQGGTPAVTVPFAPRCHFGAEEKAACNRILDEAIAKGEAPGYNGPERFALGEEFAALLGGGYAECVNSGTGSVYVALRSQEIPPFSEVICPAVTDPGGMMPIPLMNCIPVPADCAPGSFNMSIEGVRRAYSERTAAILVAHIAGEPCADIEQIRDFAKEKGIFLIEDCAQSHGARLNGQNVGTFGDAAGFSMMFGKHTCVGGQGGLVWTRTKEAWNRARQCADRGKPYGVEEPQGNVLASLNYNMDDLHAAIGRVQIQKMFPIAARRRQVADRLLSAIADIPALSPPTLPAGAEPSWWFLRLLLDESRITVNKATFCAALMAEGLTANPRYPATPYEYPWYRESRIFGNSGYPWASPLYTGDKEKRWSLADLPETARSLDRTLILYPHEGWTEQNICEAAEALHKVYNAYRK